MSLKQLKVALTFDDGPYPPYTLRILDLLDKYRVSATFFVCGKNIEKHTSLTKAILKRGHRLGNHSYYHDSLSTSIGLNLGEIIRTQKIIDSYAKNNEWIFRSPYAGAPPWLLMVLKIIGFKIAPTRKCVWGHDYREGITSSEILENILPNLKDGSVVLLHDGDSIRQEKSRMETVKAVEQLLKYFNKNQIKVVDILSLLKEKRDINIFYP